MGFFDLPPNVLIILAIILAYLMIEELDTAEQNTLGNWLQLIGQTLETSSAQEQLLNAKAMQNKNKELEERLKKLEDIVSNLRI